MSLKPCPFCGAEASVVVYSRNAVVACGQPQRRCVVNPSVTAKDKKTAADLWNSRPFLREETIRAEARREGYAQALKDVRAGLNPVLVGARGWKLFDRVYDVIDRIEKGET